MDATSRTRIAGFLKSDISLGNGRITSYNVCYTKLLRHVGPAGIVYLGDVRMIHHRQGLSLGLEPGHDFPGVHTRLDDLEGDASAVV